MTDPAVKGTIRNIVLGVAIVATLGLEWYATRSCNDTSSNVKENAVADLKQEARDICKGYQGGATDMKYLQDKRFSTKVAEANWMLRKITDQNCTAQWYCNMPAEGNGVFRDRGIKCENYK